MPKSSLERKVHAAAPRAVAAVAVSLLAFLAAPRSTGAAEPEDFAVFGLRGVRIGSHSHVVGALGSNRVVILGDQATISGDVLADSVRAGVAGMAWEIDGDLRTNHLPAMAPSHVAGAVEVPLSLPVLASLGALPPAAPGVVDVRVADHDVLDLPPGAYRNVRVGPGARLTLAGGDYQLRNLRTGAGAEIRFLGPTTLRIAQQLWLGRGTSAEGASEVDSSEVWIQVDGAGVAWIGPHGRLGAVLRAPAGVIALLGGTQVQGALLARSVHIGRYARVELGVGTRIAVPNLIGLAEADAIAALEAVGLVPGAIMGRPSAMVPAGAVSSQEPGRGASVPVGAAIALEVSAPIDSGALPVPDGWVGSWQLQLTTRDPATGNRLAVESLAGAICPGDPVGVEQVEPATGGLAACAGQVQDETLSVVCAGGAALEDCTVAGELELVLVRIGDALVGSGAFHGSATGAGCGDTEAAESFDILAERVSPDPGACAPPASSLTQKFLRHAGWTRLEGGLR